MKKESRVSGEELSLLQNSVIKSVWGLTSGGSEEVGERMDSNRGKHLSILTRALIESLDPENKDSIFKSGKISDLSHLFSSVKQKMDYGKNSLAHFPGCGSFLQISSSNVSEKGITLFSSSFGHLKVKTTKALIFKRKKQMEELISSPYYFYKMVPLKNIS